MITQTFKVVFKENILLDEKHIKQIGQAYCMNIANIASSRVLLIEPDQQKINKDIELKDKQVFNILIAFLIEITLGEVETIGLIQQVIDYELNWENIYT
jgi:hypothetical protein